MSALDGSRPSGILIAVCGWPESCTWYISFISSCSYCGKTHVLVRTFKYTMYEHHCNLCIIHARPFHHSHEVGESREEQLSYVATVLVPGGSIDRHRCGSSPLYLVPEYRIGEEADKVIIRIRSQEEEEIIAIDVAHRQRCDSSCNYAQQHKMLRSSRRRRTRRISTHLHPYR